MAKATIMISPLQKAWMEENEPNLMARILAAKADYAKTHPTRGGYDHRSSEDLKRYLAQADAKADRIRAALAKRNGA